LALRGRLIRLLRSGVNDEQVDQLAFLAEQAAVKADSDKRLREIVDALHSTVFPHLPPPLQRQILERWVDRGNRSAMARWLKATNEHPETYDANVALRYWHATKDPRAAKSLAYLADLEALRGIVPDLVRVCEEGWIIARAIIRIGDAGDDCWHLISAHHPATYLYLCAQLNRAIGPDEAYELVCRCSGAALEGSRGLAIWAIGQMGMVSVLDRIEASVDELQEQDMAALRVRFPTIRNGVAD
jgi:hypothetical protein